jgi:hypothetical protein
MGDVLGHKGHLLRVAALFGVGVVVFLVLQALLMPEGFGAHGHYRSGALDDSRARRLGHAGQQACVECHADVAGLKAKGRHGGVRCEACHGPLAVHAADPSATKVGRPEPQVLCARCHEHNAARPSGFPQVDVGEHSGGESCITCHQPHDPLDSAAQGDATAGAPVVAAQKGAAR